MLPTDILREDHDLILLVLKGMKTELKNFENSGKINIDKIEKFIDFTENFSDGYHHIKEEQRLFRMLEEHGMAKDSNPISGLLKEHLVDKEFIKSISKNLDAARKGVPEALKEIKENLSSYIDMVKNHIYTENNILFNKAERLLSKSDMDKLIMEYKEFEKQKPVELIHKKYHKIAYEIAGSKP
ncbi:MAG: hemerythrin domain-containing protein [FCB group bacterium]|jgi:hemerythrin-like domain-containing protein